MLESRSDDAAERGGADLPRRSLCSAFTLLLLKPGANFKNLYMRSLGDQAAPQRRRCRRSSSPQQRSRLY